MDFRAKLVTWSEIEKWCETINRKMLEDFKPDVIIGLSRGGLVPARILSDINLIKDLYAIKTEHWGLTATVDGTAVLKYGLNVPVEGKKVIIVDDITDTELIIPCCIFCHSLLFFQSWTSGREPFPV